MQLTYVLLIIPILFEANPINDIPPLNKKIIEYVNQVIGTQVGRGECWDLAAESLAYSGAYFDRSTKKSILIYGRKINPNKNEIFPGDIIQFEKVTIKYSINNITYTNQMPHHTAIVYKVNSKGDYDIAHQNTSFSSRKVGISKLKLMHIENGECKFYRPLEP